MTLILYSKLMSDTPFLMHNIDPSTNHADLCLVRAMPENFKLAQALLSEREKLVFSKIIANKQPDWLLGRLAAKLAGKAHLEKNSLQVIEPGDLEVIPQLTGGPKLFLLAGSQFVVTKALPRLSIAHTKGEMAVAAAVGSNSCVGLGVDIEFVREFTFDFQRGFMTTQEFSYISSLPKIEQPIASTALWTLKESYLKATGVGLRQNPRSIDLLACLKKQESFKVAVLGGWAEGSWTQLDHKVIVSHIILKFV